MCSVKFEPFEQSRWCDRVSEAEYAVDRYFSAVCELYAGSFARAEHLPDRLREHLYLARSSSIRSISSSCISAITCSITCRLFPVLSAGICRGNIHFVRHLRKILDLVLEPRVAAEHSDSFAPVEESVTRCAVADAAAEQLLLAFESLGRSRTGREQNRFGLVHVRTRRKHVNIAHRHDRRHHLLGDLNAHLLSVRLEFADQILAGDIAHARIVSDLLGLLDFGAQVLRSEPDEFLVMQLEIDSR